ncbi:MAG: N-acetylmuramoyl-L-alanine amidase [Bdellovibrio sp.]
MKSFFKWLFKKNTTNVVDQPIENTTGVVTGKFEIWYPKAVRNHLGIMKTKGTYRNGYPEGAIVHATAGHCDSEQDAINSLKWGIDQGLAFFVIGPTGKVYQNFPLSHWGNHAGVSNWLNLGSSVSQYLVGIEVACANKVDENGTAWFGKTYGINRLRVSEKKENIKAGTYVKYTKEQELALLDLLVWLKKNNPTVFSITNIAGHDEVSPGRKDDPGASLSMTMPELRMKVGNLITQKEIPLTNT